MSDNMKLWDSLCITDPKHTKSFKRAGGFSGTAIKPIWATKRMTEVFGPVGIGWGMTKPEYQVVSGHNQETLVYCTVGLWHGSKDNIVYGVGGDKVTGYIKANPTRGTPERWENDDEAFKKAFTDALSNAMKHLGVGADVHMGQFEDSKYVAEATKHYAEPEYQPPVFELLEGEDGAYDTQHYIAQMTDEVKHIKTEQEWRDLWKANKKVVEGLLQEVDKKAYTDVKQLFSEKYKAIYG